MHFKIGLIVATLASVLPSILAFAGDDIKLGIAEYQLTLHLANSPNHVVTNGKQVDIFYTEKTNAETRLDLDSVSRATGSLSGAHVTLDANTGEYVLALTVPSQFESRHGMKLPIDFKTCKAVGKLPLRVSCEPAVGTKESKITVEITSIKFGTFVPDSE